MIYLSIRSAIRQVAGCIFLILFLLPDIEAQKAKDVLEKGQHVKNGRKIFLRKEGNVLKYDVNETPKDLTTLEDETIFLVEKNELNIYIRPLNPLNFQLKTSNVVVVDPITEEVGNVSKALFDVLGTVSNKGVSTQASCKYTDGKFALERLRDSLSKDQKPKMVELFKKLKALSFEDEQSTKAELDKVEGSIEAMASHYSIMESDIAEINNIIKTYNCPEPDTLIATFVFSSILKELTAMRSEQMKRLDNLKEVFKLVRDMQVKASTEKDGLRWFVVPDGIPATEGKISVYTISISEGGYRLSDNNEIVAVTSTEIIKRSFRVRRFQRFVPEVSAGTAYTFFDYPQYGTTKNAAGEEVVGDPTQKRISNLNFTAMINYNYYLPNSPIHPFWQIGIGANNDIPTILTGLGIRANFAGLRRLAISGGLALTWIKQLNKLKPGDKVSGTADIDKDLTYEFNRKAPLYLGIQFNF